MRYLFLILILASQSVIVFSQTEINLISGVVTDPMEAVIPNAKVSASLLNKNESAESKIFESLTNDEGNFIFKNLPSGEYKLTATAKAFGSDTERRISVPQNKFVEIKVVIPVGLGCEKLSDSDGAGTLTDADKIEIVTLAVNDALSTNSGLLMSEQREKGIKVSTKNIKIDWLKNVTNLKLKFMSQNQIQQKADREKDFLYVSFPYFKIKGSCVALEIANTWAVGKNSKFVYLSGGGQRYEFRKEGDKWIKKSLGGWIS